MSYEKLDIRQFFEKVYDKVTERLKVSAIIESLTLTSSDDSVSVMPLMTANDIDEATIAFGSVGAAYSTLLDNSTNIHQRLILDNTLDNSTIIRFGEDDNNTISLDAGEDIDMASFKHTGKIEIKRDAGASTSGRIKARSY